MIKPKIKVRKDGRVTLTMRPIDAQLLFNALACSYMHDSVDAFNEGELGVSKAFEDDSDYYSRIADYFESLQ